jgi:hypothetical protein
VFMVFRVVMWVSAVCLGRIIILNLRDYEFIWWTLVPRSMGDHERELDETVMNPGLRP